MAEPLSMSSIANSMLLANHGITPMSILQVVQVIKTDVFSTSSSSWTDWTGMNKDIQLSAGSVKNIISVTSGSSNDSQNAFQYVSLWYNLNGGAYTQIALGDVAGSATRCWMDAGFAGSTDAFDTSTKPICGVFVHTHGAFAGDILNYKLKVIRTFNGTAYFGRSANTSDANRPSVPSSLVIMEST